MMPIYAALVIIAFALIGGAMLGYVIGYKCGGDYVEKLHRH
jgi:hypothetical protein